MIEADPLMESVRHTCKFPWQIHAMLAAKKAGAPVAELVSAATSGALGDTVFWYRSETVLRSGIEISMLGFPAGMLSVSSGELGALIESGGVRCGKVDLALTVEFVRSVADALPRLRPESGAVKALMYLCGALTLRASRNWSPHDALAIKNIIMCARYMDVRMSVGLLMSVLRSYLSTWERLSILAAIGTHLDPEWWWYESGEFDASVNDSSAEIVAAIGAEDSKLRGCGTSNSGLGLEHPETFGRTRGGV
jgi:hypothetical protein